MNIIKRLEDKKHTAAAAGLAVICFAFVMKFLSMNVGYFGVNTMSCIRGRYFFVSRLAKKLKDGDYFAFYFRGSRLYQEGTEFIKLVACSQGERLSTKKTRDGTAYYCNGRLLGYACSRRKYRDCPQHIVYNGIIPKGCYFAMGTAYNAYDSRYYGLVCRGIIGRAYRIL